AIDNGLVSQLAPQTVDPIHLGKPGYVGGRAGATGFGNGYGGLYQDRDHYVDRVIGANDTPHIFNFGGPYELPFGYGRSFLNRKGVLNQILGGWHFTGNFNAQSGIPLTIGCPGNQVTSRCNLVGDPKFSGSRSRDQQIAQWFNPAAFEPPFGSDQSFWANYDP